MPCRDLTAPNRERPGAGFIHFRRRSLPLRLPVLAKPDSDLRSRPQLRLISRA
jgi:hypothetical protein